MSTSTITIKMNNENPKKVLVELDANKFEKLAATLGFFNPEFLRSVGKAEQDYRAGRYRKIKSLKELRAA